jgi:two-component system response regulator AtoC
MESEPMQIVDAAQGGLDWAYDRLKLARSTAMREVLALVDQVAATDVTVLIRGESGTGKEVAARAIHSRSGRSRRPFVKVNCAALPKELLESELFGYDKGAFTGAVREKPGKFELADGGTLFLDEIGDLDVALQSKLLHLLQEGEICRLGGGAPRRIDARIIAATNKNLEAAVRQKQFREDLFYRLNVIHMDIPPLRQRRDEIGDLMDYFLTLYAERYARSAPGLADATRTLLLRYDWPGNVREIENVARRIVLLGQGDAIRAELAQHVRRAGAEQAPRSLREISRAAKKRLERETILRALEQARWNRRVAASQLQISYRSLLYKIKELELNGQTTGGGPREDYREECG